MTNEEWVLYIKLNLIKLDEGEIDVMDWRKEILQMQRKEKYADLTTDSSDLKLDRAPSNVS